MPELPERIAGLQTIAEREASLLADYAMHSADSAGRKYPEPEHSYRGPFQRDRDRILHSAAYRRLSGKTQVFTRAMGDYHRTRLTHTQEVASIARTLARALRLNEDLVEALALFHDIGHPPFGHAGEDALNECLADIGGFSHNRHALTIAEELETRYQQFRGLNLSFEVLQGQATRVSGPPQIQSHARDVHADSHCQPGSRSGNETAEAAQPLLEVQVVDAADSVTYDAHDTDDAVALGIVSLDQLAEVPLIHGLLERVRQRFTGLNTETLRKALVHELIDSQVGDVLRCSGKWLSAAAPRSAQDARRSDFVVGPSQALAEQKEELEAFLYEQVYRHARGLAVRQDAQQRLIAMFNGYLDRPDLLPEKFQDRVDQVGLRRSVGEYLAGMTDRFCGQQYRRYFATDTGGSLTGEPPVRI